MSAHSSVRFASAKASIGGAFVHSTTFATGGSFLASSGPDRSRSHWTLFQTESMTEHIERNCRRFVPQRRASSRWNNLPSHLAVTLREPAYAYGSGLGIDEWAETIIGVHLDPRLETLHRRLPTGPDGARGRQKYLVPPV